MAVMVFKCSLFAIYYNYVFNHRVEALEYGFLLLEPIFAIITNFVMNIFAHQSLSQSLMTSLG